MLLQPDREWSLTELARSVGASVATVQREVRRAEDAGLVLTRKRGNTRLVRADPDGVLTPPMTELLLRAIGPKQLLGEALAGIPDIDAAYIFGSWAARYASLGGPAPHDIDVLVIGRPDRDLVDDAVVSVEERLARPVQVTIRSREWWERGDDALRRDIARTPLVELTERQDEITAP